MVHWDPNIDRAKFGHRRRGSGGNKSMFSPQSNISNSKDDQTSFFSDDVNSYISLASSMTSPVNTSSMSLDMNRNKQKSNANTDDENTPYKKVQINVANVSIGIRIEDIEDWKMEPLYLSNTNTLLFEISGVKLILNTINNNLARNILWTKLQDYNISVAGTCLRFLMTQCKRINNIASNSSSKPLIPNVNDRLIAHGYDNIIENKNDNNNDNSSMLSDDEEIDIYIWRQILFDEETMKSINSDFMRLEDLLFKYNISKNVKINRSKDLPTKVPETTELKGRINTGSVNNNIKDDIGLRKESKINDLQFTFEVNSVNGSFSLRQSHFIFTALSAFSNAIELISVINNKPFLNKTGHEWQNIFRSLRPKPSARSPFDDMMSKSVFNFALGSSKIKLELYGDYPELKKKRDSTFGIIVSSIICNTVRNDNVRTLFQGPLNDQIIVVHSPGINAANSYTSLKAPKVHKNFIHLSMTASPKLVSWMLPKDVPLRRGINTKHPGPKSGTIKCRIQSIGIIWDAVLHDMASYGALLSFEINKIVKQISREFRSKNKRKHTDKNDDIKIDNGSPSPPDVKPEMSQSQSRATISSNYSENDSSSELDITNTAIYDKNGNMNIHSWRILISKLNTMIVDCEVEPFKFVWCLSDPFHMRDDLLLNNTHTNMVNTKSFHDIIIKTPKIQLNIVNDVTLFFKDFYLYSQKHDKSMKSFEQYMMPNPNPQNMYPIIQPWNIKIHSTTQFRKIINDSNNGIFFDNNDSNNANNNSNLNQVKFLKLDLSCNHLDMSINAHQVVCISSVLRGLFTQRFITDETNDYSFGSYSNYDGSSYQDWRNKKKPKLKNISKTYFMQKQIAKKTLPVTIDIKISSLTCKFYPNLSNSNIIDSKKINKDLNNNYNYVKFKIEDISLSSDLNKSLELTRWKGSLNKISCKYLHYKKGLLMHPSHQLLLIKKITSFYSQQTPKNKRLNYTNNVLSSSNDPLKFIYIQAHIEPIKIVYNIEIIDKMIYLFKLLKLPDLTLYSKQKAKQEWIKQMGNKKIERSVSYLNLASKGYQANVIKYKNNENNTSNLNRNINANDGNIKTKTNNTDEKKDNDNIDIVLNNNLPLTEENLKRVTELQNKYLYSNKPMPNDPSQLVKANKSVVTQVWACIKIDGIQICVPSERPSLNYNYGVSLQFDKLTFHSTSLSNDLKNLSPLPFVQQNSSFHTCDLCKKLLKQCHLRTTPSTPTASMLSSSNVNITSNASLNNSSLNNSNPSNLHKSNNNIDTSSVYDDTHVMTIKSKLEGLKIFLTKWPLLPDNNSDINVFYKEIHFDYGLIALDMLNEYEQKKIKFSTHMLSNDVQITSNLKISSNLTLFTRYFELDVNWGNVKGIASVEELAIILTTIKNLSSKFIGDDNITNTNNVSHVKSNNDWLMTWESNAKLTAKLPLLTIDIKLDKQSKISPWFKLQITDIYSEHNMQNNKLDGYFKCDNIAVQFYKENKAYCLLSLRESSRPTPTIIIHDKIKSYKTYNVGTDIHRRSSAPTQFNLPKQGLNDSNNSNNNNSDIIFENKVFYENDKYDDKKPAIFINYTNGTKKRQETTHGHSMSDSQINVEVVGFDLLIPFEILDLLLRSVNRLSLLSNLNQKKRFQRNKYNYNDIYTSNQYYKPMVPAGQEKMVNELDKVIPGFKSRKIRVIIYGLSVGLTNNLTSVHTMTRYLIKQQHKKSDYLIKQWQIKPSDIIDDKDKKKQDINARDSNAKGNRKSSKKDKGITNNIDVKMDDDTDDILTEQERLNIMYSHENDYQTPRMYHRCPHCNYNNNSANTTEEINYNDSTYENSDSTTALIYCSNIYLSSLPSDVEPGEKVASITNSNTIDISGLYCEVGHNLHYDQILSKIMQPMELKLTQQIKWLVATSPDGRWPIGCPFEPITNLALNVQEINVQIEQQHILTINMIAKQLDNIIQHTKLNNSDSYSYTYVSSSSSNKDIQPQNIHVNSPSPPPNKGSININIQDITDEQVVSPLVNEDVDEQNNNATNDTTTKDKWDDVDSDEADDQFDINPNHSRVRSMSFSYSKSYSMSNTLTQSNSMTYNHYQKWFFQNDLTAMKWGYTDQTDNDGRPLVNHLICSEGKNIDLHAKKKKKKKKKDKSSKKKIKSSKKVPKKQTSNSTDNSTSLKDDNIRWMAWRYPSPRHVSHVSTSPLYPLLANAISELEMDDSDVQSMSQSYSSIPHIPVYINTTNNNNKSKVNPSATGSQSVKSNQPDPGDMSARTSFSFDHSDTGPIVNAYHHGYMVLIGIHAWDTVLKKYVDVDSIYAQLDSHKTHTLKKTIIADEWKISWKLLPPSINQNNSNSNNIYRDKLPTMPSAFELARLIRIDSQLHVGPLYSHINLKIESSNFTIQSSTKSGLKQDLLNLDVGKSDIHLGTWKELKGNTLYNAMRLKITNIMLTSPNYRDLTEYAITNSFNLRATLRSRKDLRKFNDNTLDINTSTQVIPVPVTLAQVTPGESSIEISTSDIEIFFRRRLLFLVKNLEKSYKINQLKKKDYINTNYNYKDQSKIVGNSNELYSSAHYIIENFFSVPIWYGQMNTTQQIKLDPNNIHSYSWFNASNQKIKFSIDNGNHWSEPIEIDLDLPETNIYVPFGKNKKSDETKEDTDESPKSKKAKTKTVTQTNETPNTMEIKCQLHIKNFSCVLIVKIQTQLHVPFTKISLFPECKIQNLLDRPIAFKVAYPRFVNQIPEDLVIEKNSVTMKKSAQYYVIIWRRRGKMPKMSWKKNYKFEMKLRLLDENDMKLNDNDDENKNDEEIPLTSQFWDNCTSAQIRTTASNCPSMQIIAAKPDTKLMKDKKIDVDKIKFEEFYWFINEYKDPYFVISIRPFMTIQNRTCEPLWVLDELSLQKARLQLKKSANTATPSKSKSKTKSVEASPIVSDIKANNNNDNNINNNNDIAGDIGNNNDNDVDGKNDEMVNPTLIMPQNITPKLIRQYGSKLLPGEFTSSLMLPDLTQDFILYFSTKSENLVATHIMKMQVYKDSVVSRFVKMFPVDIIEQTETIKSNDNISDENDITVETNLNDNNTSSIKAKSRLFNDNGVKLDESEEENNSVDMNKLTSPISPKAGNDDDNEANDPEIEDENDMNNDEKNDNINTTTTKSIESMNKYLILRQHTISSFTSKDNKQLNNGPKKIKTHEDAEVEKISNYPCVKKTIEASRYQYRKYPSLLPIQSKILTPDIYASHLRISIHAGIQLRNRTNHKIHIRCTELNNVFAKEETITILPKQKDELFWPTNLSLVFRLLLEPNNDNGNNNSDLYDTQKQRIRWSKPVTISNGDKPESYQIHAIWGSLIHVCVLTYDRIDSEIIHIDIRPKHIIHNKIGRDLLLWPCGMIDRSLPHIPIDSLNDDNIMNISQNSHQTITEWNMDLTINTNNNETSQSRNSSFSSANLDHQNSTSSMSGIRRGNATRVVSAAVRFKFDDEMDTKWNWSKQLFIPSTISRGRRHVLIKNTTNGYEDLVSFVTLQHRDVVHTIFFRCGQPPCLIRNETNHQLKFGQIKSQNINNNSSSNSEINQDNVSFHFISPYQSSAFDWRSEYKDNDNYDKNIKDKKKRRVYKDFEDEEKIFEKSTPPIALVFNIDGYSISEKVNLRHGLNKTITLTKIKDDLMGNKWTGYEITLNIRVLVRRATFIVEVLHIHNNTNTNAANAIASPTAIIHPHNHSGSYTSSKWQSQKMYGKHTHSHTHQNLTQIQSKPQKFDLLSLKVAFSAISIRLQKELGRDIHELLNLHAQKLVIDLSKQKQEQWPTPILYNNPIQSRRNPSISSFHPSKLMPDNNNNTNNNSNTATNNVNNNLSGNIPMKAEHSPTPSLSNVSPPPVMATNKYINSLPPPTTSICTQYSLNIKLHSYQIDDQSMKPEFPVISCFDPTHKRNINISRPSSNAKLVICVVWQSPLEASNTHNLVREVPRSYMLKQYQQQRHRYFHPRNHSNTQTNTKTRKNSQSMTMNIPSKLIKKIPSKIHKLKSDSEEIIYFEESVSKTRSKVPAYITHINIDDEKYIIHHNNNKDDNNDVNVWRIDGLQLESDIDGAFPDFKLISIYIHPFLVNTSDEKIIQLYKYFVSASLVRVPNFDDPDFKEMYNLGQIPFCSENEYNIEESKTETSKRKYSYSISKTTDNIDNLTNDDWMYNVINETGVDNDFIALIRSVTRPRLYLHSFNIAELTFRLSISMRELPIHIGLGKAPFKFQPISLSFVNSAPDHFFKNIGSTYFADIILRSPQVLGSLNTLGNPSQLVENVATGFKKLISTPIDSLNNNESKTAFIWGLGNGFMHLLQHVSEGTFTSLSTFSDSLARNVERLSTDENYSKTRQQMRNNSDNYGWASGLVSFSHSVIGGISGVYSNPSRGYREGGAWGFMKGVGTGLVGAFTKPISGALDLVSAASKSIAETTGSKTNKTEPKIKLDMNPYKIDTYSKAKYKLMSIRRNEIYIKHFENINILKKRENKRDRKYGTTRNKCSLILTNCGIYIIDDPIFDDKINEAFLWHHIQYINENNNEIKDEKNDDDNYDISLSTINNKNNNNNNNDNSNNNNNSKDGGCNKTLILNSDYLAWTNNKQFVTFDNNNNVINDEFKINNDIILDTDNPLILLSDYYKLNANNIAYKTLQNDKINNNDDTSNTSKYKHSKKDSKGKIINTDTLKLTGPIVMTIVCNTKKDNANLKKTINNLKTISKEMQEYWKRQYKKRRNSELIKIQKQKLLQKQLKLHLSTKNQERKDSNDNKTNETKQKDTNSLNISDILSSTLYNNSNNNNSNDSKVSRIPSLVLENDNKADDVTIINDNNNNDNDSNNGTIMDNDSNKKNKTGYMKLINDDEDIESNPAVTPSLNSKQLT